MRSDRSWECMHRVLIAVCIFRRLTDALLFGRINLRLPTLQIGVTHEDILVQRNIRMAQQHLNHARILIFQRNGCPVIAPACDQIL